MVHTYIADDEDLVKDAVRAPFTEYLRSSIGLIENLVRSLDLPLDLATMSKDDLDALLAFAFDRYYEGNALFGTATSVQPTLERLANAGVDEIACLVDFGLPDEQVLAGLEQLADARDQLRGAASGSVWPLAELIRRHQPTVLQCTPSMMQILAHDREVLSGLTGLRALLLGGETLPEPLAEMIRAELPDTRLYNMYGPTETTIWSSVHAVDAIDGSVPIGRPLVNTQLYAVDTTLRPVPIGVAGELLIGGDGVTNGYHGRPAATAERFVPDPFGTHPGRRLYRTGDLVRWRADGALEFLGRTDRQVKVNGHRIELGEIEHAIGGVPGVSGSVVVAAPSDLGDVRITAYVVPATAATLTREAIADHLRRVVPAQMVPASVVILEAFPLTANGKIDVRALAAKRPSVTARRPAAVPSSALERRIAQVWCEVLGVTEVGVDDNFFAIGGHSLLMVQVHSRIKESVPTDLPLTTLLEHPTVRTLAAYLESGNSQASFQESEDRADRQRDRRRAVRAAREARA